MSSNIDCDDDKFSQNYQDITVADLHNSNTNHQIITVHTESILTMESVGNTSIINHNCDETEKITQHDEIFDELDEIDEDDFKLLLDSQLVNESTSDRIDRSYNYDNFLGHSASSSDDENDENNFNGGGQDSDFEDDEDNEINNIESTEMKHDEIYRSRQVIIRAMTPEPESEDDFFGDFNECKVIHDIVIESIPNQFLNCVNNEDDFFDEKKNSVEKHDCDNYDTFIDDDIPEVIEFRRSIPPLTAGESITYVVTYDSASF